MALNSPLIVIIIFYFLGKLWDNEMRTSVHGGRFDSGTKSASKMGQGFYSHHYLTIVLSFGSSWSFGNLGLFWRCTECRINPCVCNFLGDNNHRSCPFPLYWRGMRILGHYNVLLLGLWIIIVWDFRDFHWNPHYCSCIFYPWLGLYSINIFT